MKQRDWQGILQRIAVILGALLVLLVSIALLYIFLQVLRRFGDILTLFMLGAIIAYVLNPAVSWIAARAGRRWVGTLVVYAAAAAVLAILAIVLLQPLVSESATLRRTLGNPTGVSMRALTGMSDQSHTIAIELRSQRVLAEGGSAIPRIRIRRVRAAIARLRDDLAALGSARALAHSHRRPTRSGVTSRAQVRVPPTYLVALEASTAALASDYRRAVRNAASPSLSAVTRSVGDADRVSERANALHTTLSTTPILLLDAQTWADERHIGMDVSQSATQVVKQVRSQVSSLLNNTATILSQTGGLLLDVVLVIIISVYFVTDGERMMHGASALVPGPHQKQATFFATSLDSVLGGYIRAQIVLALAAGVLAGMGAAALGVPFALIIGVSTFVLQLVPVIGPLLIFVVPVTIALLFTSMPVPLVLFVYLVVLEQLVTNVIGPRVNSKSVGIHPLAAMAAALLGYSIGGVLGSFLAVPIAGLAHVVLKEAHSSWRADNRSSEPAAASEASTRDDASIPAPTTATAGGAPPDGLGEREPVTSRSA